MKGRFAGLPDDVTREALYYLDDKSLHETCSINDYFSETICNNSFWLNKILNKYPLTSEEIREEMTKRGMHLYKDYYIDLKHDIGILNNDEILNIAVIYGRTNLAKIALRRQKEFGYMDENFLITAYNNNTEIVKLLLERGANVHVNNEQALIRALNGLNVPMIKLLLEYGADPNADNGLAWRYVILSNDTEAIKAFLDAGANVHWNNDWALKYASTSRMSDEVVKLLLDYGASF